MNVSDVKFMPGSEINSTNTISAVFPRSSTIRLPAFLQYKTCCKNLQCTEMFYFNKHISVPTTPNSFMASHILLFSLVVQSADIHGIWHTVL